MLNNRRDACAAGPGTQWAWVGMGCMILPPREGAQGQLLLILSQGSADCPMK